MTRPVLAVTMGDAAGIGPEVVAGAWSNAALHRDCRPLVVGHPEIMRRAAALRGLDLAVQAVGDAAELRLLEPSPSRMPVLAVGGDGVLRAVPGCVDAHTGQTAYEAIVRALELAQAGDVDGMVTAPISKKALWLAGHRYPGHTELLAERCGVREFAMMLYLGPGHGVRGSAGLGVVHVTLHMALRDVFGGITAEAIRAKARLVHEVMSRMKGGPPRIGVCALNPHAGEDGLFGDEERRTIAPAVEAARREGLDAVGPLPADSLLVRARDGEFDGVVAMYHDQGHIALKLLGMHQAVNVTLGLPVVRTSVAHGTAVDIAWQGKAEASSMLEALRVAAALARERMPSSITSP